MGGLAHFIEQEGVATVQISLVREHTEAIRPPRALWVPFDLGHPLGAANDTAFQLDVLRSVLALASRADGPVVLDDYPRDAPATSGTPSGWACPVALPPPDVGDGDGEQLVAQLQAEMDLLRPWYDQGVRDRGRSAVGVSGLDVADLWAGARFLAGLATDERPDPPPAATPPMPGVIRFIADDLKSYYMEAATARPGGATAAADELQRWLFFETVFGETLRAIRDRFSAAEDEHDHRLQAGLVPTTVIAMRSSPG